MSLRVQLFKSIGISILSFLIIVFLALFPRHMDISLVGNKIVGEIGFSWGKYGQNIKDLFHEAVTTKSLGNTRYTGETSEGAVLSAIPKSLAIIATALFAGMILGTLKGILDYKLSKIRLSFLGSGTTWLFQSIPDFLILLLLQWIAIHHLRSIRFYAHDGWYAFAVPALLASIYPIMYIARITYASIANQEGQLYIKTARAKGLTERMIFYKHMMVNCFGTILTHFTALGVGILSSLLFIEYFRNYPGAALRLFQAIDYNIQYGTGPDYEVGVIIEISFFFMLLVILFQSISAIARKYIDPR